ncbi:restriction endonuclease subunit S [Paenibacillus thermoaerophilus]|uniref:Restriction endonuclease subunit S n=1 Tax=Paenibacillus thermoaerophilus TaxID=1215385 RepID=A0ABW2V6U7_9BACL|nr:restriction endonuclease subunit S [Paenibacillus thermoaerophilus]TMV17707.1 restriction endonuclease subunit S [Paenibacillus thermoaerophilus]
MNREEAYMSMLESMGRMQRQISVILDSKALEAEKARNWIAGHLRAQAYGSHGQQLKHSLAVHEQVLELIDGVTKLQLGMAGNLKVLLHPGQEESVGGYPFSASARNGENE